MTIPSNSIDISIFQNNLQINDENFTGKKETDSNEIKIKKRIVAHNNRTNIVWFCMTFN